MAQTVDVKFHRRHLLLMPSFYLLCTFTVSYLLYLTGLIKYDRPPLELHLLIALTIIFSVLATYFQAPYFSDFINSKKSFKFIQKKYSRSTEYNFFLLLLIAVGTLGILKYTIDYSNYLGGKGFFFILLFNDSGQVRSLAENVSSSGIQVSYLTWIAAFLISIDIGLQSKKKWWWLIVVLIVLINLVFVDRTRPVWILFTSIICYFSVSYYRIKKKQIAKTMIGLGVFAVSLFVVIGVWLGKVADESYTEAELPQSVQPLFLYSTSAFAYLGKEIKLEAPKDYKPVRVTYPLQKVLSAVRLVEEPPSQILDFYSIPVMTNVGSFLLPFYKDGGFVYCIIGIVIHTFLFNLLALFFLQNATRLSLIALATLCFTDFIAFFVDKIASLPTWIFILAGLFSYLLEALKRSSSLVFKVTD